MKVLCVCKGNSGRSPAMEYILRMFLKNASITSVEVESAGTLKEAGNGEACSSLMIKSAGYIGLDMTSHRRRWVGNLNLGDYDLIICAERSVESYLLWMNIAKEKIFTVEIPDPWTSQSQEYSDDIFRLILGAMHRVMAEYFYPKKFTIT